MNCRALMLIALATLAAPGAFAAHKVTFETLLHEMTSLESLSYFPEPSYTTKQFSSYDRHSTDRNVLTDANWFANGDRGQYIRAEDRNGAKEYVLMDADGPGAIVRFWSANPADAGVVRIYFDGNATPGIEMPLTDMLGGAAKPFVKPIAVELSMGWNSYLPVPYATHCKVTASKPDFYYQINYRTYEKGTKIPSATLDFLRKHENNIDTVAKALADPGAKPYLDVNTIKHSMSVSDLPIFVKPGQTYDLVNIAEQRPYGAPIEGPWAVRGLEIKLEGDVSPQLLRKTLLRVIADGQPTVLAPLGDFFGTAPGLNRFQSISCGVRDDGTMYSYWVMPFKKDLVIRLENCGDTEARGTATLAAGPYDWTENSMYFHAGFRSEYPIKTRPRQDWNFLTATGKGRFVGDMLHVTNPMKDWWGEGDEKIYVDGEAFPSHFGTGSEDYFGYAWCCPVPFTHAYHNQPRCDGPGNYGQTCVSRFHILDNIPYTKSFTFDMEVWHWAECEIALAETSYWYAFDGGTDTFAPLTAEHLYIVEPAPLPPPRRVDGALEGEELKIVEKPGDSLADRQDFGDSMSGGSHLWWRNGKVGDTLTLAFPVEKAGTYEVYAVFTKAVDYGIHTIAINGAEAVKNLDLFNDGVVETPEQRIGTFDLKKGENVLTVTITGSNPKAVKGYMFGLDYLRLVAK